MLLVEVLGHLSRGGGEGRGERRSETPGEERCGQRKRFRRGWRNEGRGAVASEGRSSHVGDCLARRGERVVGVFSFDLSVQSVSAAPEVTGQYSRGHLQSRRRVVWTGGPERGDGDVRLPSIGPCFLFLAVDLAVVKKPYNAATPI
jgi:hypothetical protein